MPPPSSLANLVKGTPWQPGVSPNPGGRPRKTPVTDAYRKFLEVPPKQRREPKTWAEKIALSEISKASAGGKGSTEAAREIADRAEGKVIQPVAVEAKVNVLALILSVHSELQNGNGRK